MAAADTFDGFVAELQAMGYMVKYGPRVEHMAVRHQSAQRSVLIDRLDSRYSESALRDYYRQLRHLPPDMRREYKAQHAPQPAQWLPPELTPVGKQKLNRQKTAAEKKLIAAQHREKQLEHERKRLTRSERTHRLCTRAGMLEKFLREPTLLTDDDVMELLTFLFHGEAA